MLFQQGIELLHMVLNNISDEDLDHLDINLTIGVIAGPNQAGKRPLHVSKMATKDSTTQSPCISQPDPDGDGRVVAGREKNVGGWGREGQTWNS